MFIQPKTLWHQWQIIKKCPQNRCLGQQTAGTDGLAWKEHCFVKIVSTLTAYSGVISTEVLLYTSHSNIKSFLYHLPKKSNLRLAHVTRVKTHTLCSNNWVLRRSFHRTKHHPIPSADLGNIFWTWHTSQAEKLLGK